MKQNTLDYHEIVNIDATPEEREKLGIGDLWINGAKCKKCGDDVRSKNRHHYAQCSCGAIAVDGGSWYGRMIGNPEDFEINIVKFNKI